jgi:hypothetical protein
VRTTSLQINRFQEGHNVLIANVFAFLFAIAMVAAGLLDLYKLAPKLVHMLQ